MHDKHCPKIKTSLVLTSGWSQFLISTAAIKKSIPFIAWDDPRKALLSLAEYTEIHMGGTSGAVSHAGLYHSGD